MANLNRDSNRVTVLGGVTDDGNATIVALPIDAATGRLKVSATGGAGTGDVTGPATNNADYIPQWDGADSKVLKNGLAAPTGAIVGTTDSQNLTNKTINKVTITAPATSATLTIVDGGSLITSGAYAVTLTATNTTGVTLPTTGTLATLAGAEALSNKTLTAPKLVDGGFVADANGNELLIGSTTASAVNEITIKNAATTADPSLTASGETNVGLKLSGKGTKGVYVDNAIWEKTVALTDGSTPALDASLGNLFYLDAGGDRTIAVPTNPPSTGYNQKIIIKHYANGGARTLALNTGAGGFAYGSDITGLTATASGKTDYIGCVWDAVASKWHVVAYVKGF